MKTLFLFFKHKVIGLISVLLITPFLLLSQPPTEDEIQQSINDGLVWLVAQQNPIDGSWNGYSSLEAGTGLALYKLCERAYELGYESPFVEEYEYHQNVIDGFNWVFDHLTIHEIRVQDHTTGATGTMDDPDVNGNGTGVCAQFNTYRETYSTGILLTALAASGTPARVVNVASSPVNGWLFADVVQDMVDFLAFGQVEYPVPGITVEGGWEYFHMDNGIYGSGWMGDQSNSGYAVLGLSVAQDFGAIIPAWVKTELNAWIDYVQDDVDDPVQSNYGGSWYSFPGDFIGVNTLKTGNLLSQMAFVGDVPTTPRVLDAIDYLKRHWGDASGGNSPPGWDGNPAQYQAMFCLMKGLVFIGIDEFNGTNWFDDFATAIVAQQYLPDPPDANHGAWLTSSGRGEPVIITEWALLTLEKIAPPPPVVYVDFDVHPTSWPNPINTKSGGLTPMAILGTADFDVTMIDPATLYLDLLDGMVYPIRWAYEDVTQPAGTDSDCNDTEEGPDGFMDLTLKFDTQEMIAALGEVNDGDELILKIVGNLMDDGLLIEGDDCIWIKKKTNKSADINNLVGGFELFNYPDPFNGTTTITFTLEEANHVTLKVYNTLGIEVATLYNGDANAEQRYMLEFNGDLLSEGLYFYVLRSNETILGMNKMLMMK